MVRYVAPAGAPEGTITPTGPWSLAAVNFAGIWLFRRSVDNGASMIGTATIAGHDDRQWNYHEHGQLRLASGQMIEGERRYIFEQRCGGFSVLFAESPPRLFHRIVLHRMGSCLVGDGLHLCGDDRYDTRYEFRPDGSFVVAHAVHGPRKRYAITTRYTRSRSP